MKWRRCSENATVHIAVMIISAVVVHCEYLKKKKKESEQTSKVMEHGTYASCDSSPLFDFLSLLFDVREYKYE